MVRAIVTPNNKIISFEIPKEYIGKQIEVIAFAKDEGISERPEEKRMSFKVLHVDNKNYKFNRDEANER